MPLIHLARVGSAIALISLFSCAKTKDPLPYLGQSTTENGKVIHHKVGSFRYLNQDSNWIDNQVLSQSIYVADFFFTSCPSICPKVTREMMRIHEAFAGDTTVKFVSFTLDPKRDTVKKLKLYADNLGIDQNRWYFLTGDKDSTLTLAHRFFVAALEDPEAPGGFDHSGKIVLIDKEGHVRSFSEGTDPASTPAMIEDIKTLANSYKK